MRPPHTLRRSLPWLAVGACALLGTPASKSATWLGLGSGGPLPVLYDVPNATYTPFGCTLPTPTGPQVDLEVRQRVVVHVDPDIAEQAHLTRVDVELTPKDVNGNVGPVVPLTLEVGYNPSPDPGVTYTDTVVHQLLDAYDVEALVVGVATTLDHVPLNVSVRMECDLDRVQPIAGPATNISVTQGQPGEDVRVSWDPVEGAESYQVRYAWISSDDGAGGTLSQGDLYLGDGVGPDTPLPSTTLLPTDLHRDATRLDVPFTWVDIPDLFERGWLVVQVRPVGLAGPDWDQVDVGPWAPALSAGWTPLSSHPARILLDGHDAHLTWQWTASFAEEGKRKDVKSYLDGALYTRQTVSRLNSDDNVVVGETVYDFAGRAAVQALPVPTDDSPLIHFRQDFNRSAATGKPYDIADFDLDDGTCDAAAEPMDTASGASRYYSPDTPSFPGKPFQAYVPDAHGFPFTEVE